VAGRLVPASAIILALCIWLRGAGTSVATTAVADSKTIKTRSLERFPNQPSGTHSRLTLVDVFGPLADASSIPIVMVVPLVDHDLGVLAVRPIPVIPMPVSLAYLHPSALDPNIGALRDDYRFINNDRTGKCRHGEEWNSTQNKNGFLHSTFSSLFRTFDVPIFASLSGWYCGVCIELNTDSRNASERAFPAKR